MHVTDLKDLRGMRRRVSIVLLVLILASSLVSADEMTDLVSALKKIAAGLATLLIAIQGLKYVTAQTPEDRAEAKKGLIYIILGLLVAAIAANLVCGLYCAAIASTYGGFTCTIALGICSIS